MKEPRHNSPFWVISYKKNLTFPKFTFFSSGTSFFTKNAEPVRFLLSQGFYSFRFTTVPHFSYSLYIYYFCFSKTYKDRAKMMNFDEPLTAAREK
jgi:hypothetical protein